MSPTQTIRTPWVVALVIAAVPVAGSAITSVFQLSELRSDIAQVKKDIALIREWHAGDAKTLDNLGRVDDEIKRRLDRLEGPGH